MTLEESKNTEDQIEEVRGVRFVLDPMAGRYLKGATVDYSSSLWGEGFRIIGPGVSNC